MRASDLRDLLPRLDAGPADVLETDQLDFTRWEREAGPRERALRESVVCFANARGGTIVVGVRDKVRTRKEAVEGIGPCDLGALKRCIYDGTDPHILVDLETLDVPEGKLLLIHVPRGIPPHTTSDGVGRIRVGKECKPLKGSQLGALVFTRGNQDITAQAIPDSSVSDIDPTQVQRLRRIVAGEGGNPKLAGIADSLELLRNLHLVRDGELTFAAVLLLGNSSAISRWAPQHEVSFFRFRKRTAYDVRKDLKGPLLDVLDTFQRLLEANLRIATIPTTGFGELAIPDLTWYAAREAILNALVHRDWFVGQSVHIELHPDRLEITSPGGFVGDVRADNVLRHPPVRRNPLLASVLQTIGLVNRAGLGVDRIYEELLRLGKAMPRYSSDESHVRLTLPLATHEAFARFVAREAQDGRELSLDDLILLRTAAELGLVDRRTGAERLQCDEEETHRQLAALRERGHLVARGRGRGTAYGLNRELSDQLRGLAETNLDLELDDATVRVRVQAVLAERGRLTNADVRRLSGYSRPHVARLMLSLRQEGLAVLRGAGRAAFYEPGPATVPRRRKRS